MYEHTVEIDDVRCPATLAGISQVMGNPKLVTPDTLDKVACEVVDQLESDYLSGDVAKLLIAGLVALRDGAKR